MLAALTMRRTSRSDVKFPKTMRHRRMAAGSRRRRFRFPAGVLVLAAVVFLNAGRGSTLAAADSTATNARPDVDYWEDDQEAMPGIAGNVKTNSGSLSELTTVDEVLRLNPEEAHRGYPVRIHGVVTCVIQEHNAFIIQDTTRAVFVINTAPAIALPRRGEALEVEGKSDKGSFAPLVRASRLKILGAGTLPEPVQPSWDQLMNGSLDDQLVEIRGVVEESVPHPAGYPGPWS